MENLPFHWDVLIFNVFALHWHILSIVFWNYLRDISSNMLNSIIVSRCDFPGHDIHFDDFLVVGDGPTPGDERIPGFIYVVDDFLFHRDILDSAFSFDQILSNPLLYFRNAVRRSHVSWRRLPGSRSGPKSWRR